jgi:hypothetical protein
LIGSVPTTFQAPGRGSTSHSIRGGGVG